MTHPVPAEVAAWHQQVTTGLTPHPDRLYEVYLELDHLCETAGQVTPSMRIDGDGTVLWVGVDHDTGTILVNPRLAQLTDEQIRHQLAHALVDRRLGKPARLLLSARAAWTLTVGLLGMMAVLVLDRIGIAGPVLYTLTSAGLGLLIGSTIAHRRRGRRIRAALQAAYRPNGGGDRQ